MIGESTLEHHRSHATIMEINQANVVFTAGDLHNNHTAKYCAYSVSDECYQCHANLMCCFTPEKNCTKNVDTRWPLDITVRQEGLHCSIHKLFGQDGKYVFSIFPNETDSDLNCGLDTVKNPINIYLAILTAVSVYVGIFLLCHIIKFFYQKGFFNRCLALWYMAHQSVVLEVTDQSSIISSTNSSSDDDKLPVKIKKRLHSLDTFRGIALTIMVFVNYGGGGYWFFKHSIWNGLTVADLVFPWFMWIMGVSMTFSLKGLLRKSLPKWVIFIKILRRALILFFLGIVVNQSFDVHKLRVPGVLQRFAIAYFVVGSIQLLFIKAGDVTQNHWYSVGIYFKDKLKYFLEWIIIMVFPAMNVLLTFYLNVPDCPKGYLGPGGNNLIDKKLANCTGGAAGYIDKIVFGKSHIYQRPTCKHVYDANQPYDPEGLLGCLNSIFLVFLGLKASKILVMYQSPKIIVGWWTWWSFITSIIAGTLCKFSQDGGYIPVNKNLWSLSYVLAMASMSFFLLTILYLIIDVKSWWSGSPFIYPGMNSILVYVGHELTHNIFPWTWLTGSSHWENLFCDLWGTTMWVVTSMWLYWHKFFLAI